jgi:hypothetical protein
MGSIRSRSKDLDFAAGSSPAAVSRHQLIVLMATEKRVKMTSLLSKSILFDGPPRVAPARHPDDG